MVVLVLEVNGANFDAFARFAAPNGRAPLYRAAALQLGAAFSVKIPKKRCKMVSVEAIKATHG